MNFFFINLQDCGHLKCRKCLLDEEDGCRQCEGSLKHEEPPNAFTAAKGEPKLSDTQQDSLNDEEGGIVKKSLMDRDDSLEGDFGLTKHVYELGYGIVGVNPLDPCVEEHYSVVNSVDECNRDTEDDSEEMPIVETFQIKMEDSDSNTNQIKVISSSNKSKGVPPHVIDTEIEIPGTGEKEKGFKCTLCTKSFRSIHQIRYHQYCDPQVEKPYKCNNCPQTFRTGYQLKQHAHLHGNLRFECTKCGKQFTHDASARKHYKKHEPGTKIVRKPQPTGEYPCEICLKIFARKDYRKKHMICHEDGKRYNCNICDKSYVRFNALKFHVQTTHNKSEEWECLDCKKTFATKQSLDRHRLVHIGVKPMHCKLCGLRSTRKDNLLRHVRSFHPDHSPHDSIEYDLEMTVEALSDNESQPALDSVDLMDEMKKNEIRSNEAQLRGNVIVMKDSKQWVEEVEEDDDGNRHIQYIDENDIIEHDTNSNNNDDVEVDSLQGTIVVLGMKSEKADTTRTRTGNASIKSSSKTINSRTVNQPISGKKAAPLDIYRKILLATDDDDAIEDCEVVQIIGE